MESLGSEHYLSIILHNTPILDVRAEVEFHAGHIPHSICIPILNNEERALVGTRYKQQGQAAAIALGEQLVSDQVKTQRLASWSHFFGDNPTGLITCFRGGLRSKTAQQWLLESGIRCPRLLGGYKAFRHFLIEQLEILSKNSTLTVISGQTGSGKTQLLRSLQAYRAVIDLERIANHRGSVFGSLGVQPQQAMFENNLSYAWVQMAQAHSAHYLIEDESRMIGRCYQPEALFTKLRTSGIVLIQEALELRIENIYQDYIQDQCSEMLFDRYYLALQKIIRRLGGLRYSEIRADLEFARTQWQLGFGADVNKIWIEKLLKYYYDPLYKQSLQRRQPKILFQGSRSDVFEFLKTQTDRSKH